MLITTAENSEHVIEPNEGKVDERVQVVIKTIEY